MIIQNYKYSEIRNFIEKLYKSLYGCIIKKINTSR
jgi:hypothetical protein